MFSTEQEIDIQFNAFFVNLQPKS